MAGTLATIDSVGNAVRFSGGAGTASTDVCIQTNDVSNCDTFELTSTTGAMAVSVSIDGTNYSPISLDDLNATTTAPVATTTAGGIYGFRGKFVKVKVAQSGATAVNNACLICAKLGR